MNFQFLFVFACMIAASNALFWTTSTTTTTTTTSVPQLTGAARQAAVTRLRAAIRNLRINGNVNYRLSSITSVSGTAARYTYQVIVYENSVRKQCAVAITNGTNARAAFRCVNQASG